MIEIDITTTTATAVWPRLRGLGDGAASTTHIAWDRATGAQLGRIVVATAPSIPDLALIAWVVVAVAERRRGLGRRLHEFAARAVGGGLLSSPSRSQLQDWTVAALCRRGWTETRYEGLRAPLWLLRPPPAVLL